MGAGSEGSLEPHAEDRARARPLQAAGHVDPQVVLRRWSARRRRPPAGAAGRAPTRAPRRPRPGRRPRTRSRAARRRTPLGRTRHSAVVYSACASSSWLPRYCAKACARSPSTPPVRELLLRRQARRWPWSRPRRAAPAWRSVRAAARCAGRPARGCSRSRRPSRGRRARARSSGRSRRACARCAGSGAPAAAARRGCRPRPPPGCRAARGRARRSSACRPGASASGRCRCARAR